MKVSAWDGTTFDCDEMGEAEAFAAVAAYTAQNPPPAVTPEVPADPAPTRDSTLDQGYLDPVENVKIKAAIYDQSRFTAMTAGLNNKLSLGEITGDTMVGFYDYEGNGVPMTCLRFRQMMSRYHDYCAYVESQF